MLRDAIREAFDEAARQLDGHGAVGKRIIEESYFGFQAHLPPVAFEEEAGALKTQLLFLVPNLQRLIQEMTAPFFARDSPFKELTDKLLWNLYEASGYPYGGNVRLSQVTFPKDSKLQGRELAFAYLKGTPFFDLLTTRVPVSLPVQTRFEHQWIVAGSGHGKTQTLQYLIANDLEHVAEGQASVVVIDSQGDLIRNILRLKAFAPGEPLHERLVLIDPTDIEYPCALNLFSLGSERLDTYTPLDREKLQNAAIELYEFILGALLGAEMTSKQGTLFRYVLRLMLLIDGATIHTFREIMSEGLEKYADAVSRLPSTARAFFETEFNGREFAQTRQQVTRRIWAVLENQTFERMFSHPKSKLDLFAEMNAGKIILINTAKELLKQSGTEIFGRFFIALIAQSAQERATLPTHQRMPTFVYVDEAQDYLDQNVSLILEQARKFNIGMILAHQYIGQLAPKLQESFAANTSIKFAGGVSSQDARFLCKMLRVEPEFIERQPKGHFAAFIRNHTARAVPLRIPFGYLEDMETMTVAELGEVRGRMRERYAVHHTALHPPSPPGTSTPTAQETMVSPTTDAKPSPKTPRQMRMVDPDTVDTRPSSDW